MSETSEPDPAATPSPGMSGTAALPPSPARGLRVEVTADEATVAVRADTSGEGFFATQRTYADTTAAAFQSAADAVRNRGDAWGKGVLGLGTALLTGIGLGKIADLFSSPPRWAWDSPANLAIVGIVLAALGVWIVGSRLARVNDPLIMRAKIGDIVTLRGRGEKDDVREIYTRFARINGYGNVCEYAETGKVLELALTEKENGHSLDDAAAVAERIRLQLGEIYVDDDELDDIDDRIDRIDSETVKHELEESRDERRAALEDARQKRIGRLIEYARDHPDKAAQRAALIRAELQATMNRAMVVVVRHRMVEATTGLWSLLGLALVVGGIYGALIAVDWVDAAGKTPDYTQQKACIDIAVTNQEKNLGYVAPPCGQW